MNAIVYVALFYNHAVKNMLNCHMIIIYLSLQAVVFSCLSYLIIFWVQVRAFGINSQSYVIR